MVVDLFSHDSCKTANVHHRNINDNKTANIKDKNFKVYNDIDIMVMYCRVISSFYFAVLVM